MTDIVTLLDRIGTDKVVLQNLDDALTSMILRQNGYTEFTFVTDEPFTPAGTTKLGLVLWLDRDQAREAFNKPTDDERKISEAELFEDATGNPLWSSQDPTSRKVAQHAAKRINGLRHRLDEATERRDHWFRERERELDNIENLQKRMAVLESAMWMAFTTPVSVKEGSAEEKELQKLYEHLGKAMNWKVAKDGQAV